MTINCENCNGACCRWWGVEFETGNRAKMEYYGKRGCKIGNIGNGMSVAVTRFVCQYLTKDNKCGIQEHKPLACKTAKVGNKLCLFIRKLEGIDK